MAIEWSEQALKTALALTQENRNIVTQVQYQISTLRHRNRLTHWQRESRKFYEQNRINLRHKVAKVRSSYVVNRQI